MSEMLQDDRLREALQSANVPVLLAMLVQLTGDRRWMQAPYEPLRNRGLGENTAGGFPDEIQQEVRSAAFDAIRHWRDTGEVALPDPPPELLVELLSVMMGEEVGEEYGPMLAAELRSLDAPATTEPLDSLPDDFNVLIIGAGMSGIAAAIRMTDAGIPYSVVEKAPAVGGTWWHNRYPGCGVDTPSALYSYTFLQRGWTKYFSLRDELYEYMEQVAADHRLQEKIRFETEVTAAHWLDDEQVWEVTLRDGAGETDVVRASLVISAVGAFARPKFPPIPGLDTFPGPVAHTARWPGDLDLAGKRVAVIGNGASSMQLVPAIVDEAASVTIFQRSPQWVAPFEMFHVEVPEELRDLSQSVPIYRAWYRLRAGWIFNDRIHQTLQKDPDWPHPERSVNRINDGHRRFFERYIDSELGDREDLKQKVTPSYPPYGKRILIDNGWYAALIRDDVELITESIASVDGNRLVLADGESREVDVIVAATGFEVSRFLAPMDIRGRGGEAIRDVWEDDNARAFMGTAVPGFPNFFMLVGPNTSGGHGGSLIATAEQQLDYLIDLLRRLFDAGQVVAEVRSEPYEAYNERVDAAHAAMIWTHPGMTTYYRNSRGRIVYTTPFRVVDFWQMTREADLGDYVTEPAAAHAIQ